MFMICIIALLVVFIVILFNRLIRHRYLVREAYSGIDVQLKRRHDLIPRVVDTVKGYSQFESKVLQDLTKIRSRLTGTIPLKEKAQIESEFSQTLKNIFALAEAYPDLKASKSYLQLQNTLSETEDQIQLARRYYNGTVRDYNIAVESFPGNVIAVAFNFKPEDFFELEYATERAVPDVKFA